MIHLMIGGQFQMETRLSDQVCFYKQQYNMGKFDRKDQSYEKLIKQEL